MTTLSNNYLIVAIQGINDAIRHNTVLLESETLINPVDTQEYVYTLSELASYLKTEYIKQRKEDSSLPSYEDLVPEAKDQ